ncbi:cellulose synthase complex outer membrane protein BcsC [Pseudomonas sp. DSV-1]|jgi:thioredoxin-like negative regulator of GroEL|uniref:cellulose synthase complex outer membrane protein BcsC n=1 Tax=Pseudomonas sp. DSV-1 TaxID=3112250 RepID=UPI002DB8A9D1|nr:cellulose synthase complex outer membrane protein BcsC [Pseudomonas sp. DSV-1]MEC4239668.1 cellulose synthase complex outer membrane protein BcsC [Pseudomonas sp. DSV-1]
MPKITTWAFLLGGLSTAAIAQPTTVQEQQQWLLEQVRIGEAMYREDLVRASLARLQLIAPNDPQALVASIRQALLDKNPDLARQRLAQLQSVAPDSAALRQAQSLMKLQDPQSLKDLQQARLFAAAGRPEEAAAIFERLFGNAPPDFATALEYLRIRSNIPGQHPQVIDQLRALDKQYPGNAGLRQTLADLLFREKRAPEALVVLQELSSDPIASNAAAEREYTYLGTLPIDRTTAQAWQGFIARYPNSPLIGEANKNLQQQQRLLGDPAWNAGAQGKQMIDQSRNPVAAEGQLRSALKQYPDDPTLYGALGMALFRQGRYAEANTSFSTARTKEQDTSNISKWQDLMDASRYRMLLSQGDKALEQKNLPAARNAFSQARKTKPADADPLIGLASVAQAEHDDIQAEALLLQARRLEPGNGSAVRGLVRLYSAQDPQKAKAFLNGLPASSQKEFSGLRQSMELDELNQQADAATERKDWPQVAALLSKIRNLSPDEPWVTYRLANAQREINQPGAADDSFKQLMNRQGRNPEAIYAYALYLSNTDRDASALSALEKLPKAQWTDSMRELDSRLQRNVLVARAERLRAEGHEPQAIALLMQTSDSDDLMTVAGWAQERGDFEQAQSLYGQVLKKDPANTGARLGQIETLIANRQLPAARQQLAQFNPAPGTVLTSSEQRRVANAWVAVGEPDKARAIYAQLLKSPQADPLVYRDAARLMSVKEPQQALDYYAKSMAAAGLITPEQANPRDNRAMTMASREKDDDQWLARSLRSDVDELYQRQNPTVHLYTDYGWRSDNASAGTSDTDTRTTILQLDLPVADGTGFLRAEQLNMDAGKFSADPDGLVRENYGTCAVKYNVKGTTSPDLSGCEDSSQSVNGTMMAAGWKNEVWNVDIGRTPDNFKVPNWLGGVAYSSKFESVGWTLTGSRRPLSNSILSYAGATDPITGITWGGVTSNGLTLSLSHDEGGVDGVWASFGQHWLRGKNVEDNHKSTAMAGYYYRLVERADERMRTGLTLMYWGYDKDLSEYTLGQGGYYSPQKYYSIGVPLNYAFRTANWSVALESSVSWSYAKTDANDLYPLSGLNDKLIQGLDERGFQLADGLGQTSGGSSTGIGYRLQGLVERRLSDHLVLGGGLLYQHSDSYAPSRAMLYLRYTFDVWQGNLPLPVQPLIPYADFR